MKEERQPHAFTTSMMAKAVEAVVPVAAADQRQAMCAQAARPADGAQAVFIERCTFAAVERSERPTTCLSLSSVDPSIIRQLRVDNCAPTCATMLLREKGVVAFQSALTVRQGSKLTEIGSGYQKLAGIMNDIEKNKAWRGGLLDTKTDPQGLFRALNANGRFSTCLKTTDMAIGHQVMVDGLDDAGRVIIRDPETCTRSLIKWEDFIEAWQGATLWRVVP